jgi:hypothetical protein
MPATMGEERKQRTSSRYVGVTLQKAQCSWLVRLTDPQTKRRRQIGYYASEEDAAKAYDSAAVQAHGPGAKRNFPGEAISELPLTVGEERKQRGSSRYVGVSSNKTGSSWCACLADPPTKRSRYIGSFASRRSQGVRLCSCAGARARCQAQLPRRVHQRAAADADARGGDIAAQQLALNVHFPAEFLLQRNNSARAGRRVRH